ncbi:MAG: chain-length determining protein [Geobacteraceae bacterium GWF2_54_21]|nr:MAG: chain-length determining protein [Geobacteraceae bacterium GWF2_54_21]
MASSEFDYKKYLNLARKNKVLCIVTALAIMTVITVVSYLLPNKFEAKSTVFIEKSVISELLKGLTFTPSAEDKIKVLSYALNSRTLISKVLDELDLKKSSEAEQEKQIKNMQDNTQIKIKDREGLFIISFRDKNPKFARDYVNALVRRYIDENTSSKRQESYGATQFVSEQLTAFKEKLDKSEEAANAFKSGSGSIASMDPSLLLKDINDSQQRLDDLRIRQTQLETALAGLSKVNSAQSNMPALQKRLQELQLQYTDNYPEIQRVKEDIRALDEQLKSGQGVAKPVDSPEYAKLASELRAIRQAEANLSSTIARNRGLLHNIPAAKATLDSLEREKHSQKTLYEAMLARQGQSEVSKQMEVQDKSTVFRVVDPAVLPYKPVSPNRVKIILMGILAGIGGGLGIVLLKDQMDSTVKNVDMAKNFGFSVLAVIPRIEDPQLLVLQSRRARKLYIFGALYFSLILAVLAVEVAGVTVISKFIGRLTS